MKDLPKSRLGVDVENGFTPSYIVIRERKKVLGDIFNSARSATAVFLAPDPDREGEAIDWHIAGAIRTDVSCPECKDGEVVERSSRFGKIFYSCSRYPECRFASWGRPIAQGCPVCGYPAMSERVRKDGSTHIACLRKGCKGRAVEPAPPRKEGAN